MNISPTARFAAFLLCSAVALAPSVGFAQARSWPDRPIKLIVPFPAAGPADAIARALADRLSNRLGQPVVVENRPGGGGDMATGVVAKTTPDGYTLLFGAGANLAISAAISNSVPFDSLRDFSPVATVATAPNILVVGSKVSAKNLTEFVAQGKAIPGGFSFASGGKGSGGHIAAEMLKTATGVPFVHVPYKGQAQALTDIMGGHVQVMFAALSGTRESIAAGKLRALAITSATRSPLAPEIPTVAESGYPGFQVASWWAVLAPAGTPTPIVKRLSAEIISVVNHPDFRSAIAIHGAEPFPLAPEQFAEFLRSEIDRATKLVAAAGIQKE
jgi:tripartite-type tricarboxylate transporter receptor subunit TctC